MTEVHTMYRVQRGLTGETIAFLESHGTAVLGTEQTDGSVHMVPLWYLFEDNRFYIETQAATQKVRNIQRRPRATVLVIDLPTSSWVSGEGEAEVIHGEEARAINKRLRDRYLTESGKEPFDQVIGEIDDVAIAVTPHTWKYWDADMFFQTIAEGGYPNDDLETWFTDLDQK
jgi:uncharacterized protein